MQESGHAFAGRGQPGSRPPAQDWMEPAGRQAEKVGHSLEYLQSFDYYVAGDENRLQLTEDKDSREAG
jgi:hypothetical protein